MSKSANLLNCFHCGLPVPDHLNLDVEIFGEQQPMCCMGCQAVARAIVENHLDDFYRHRTDNTATPETLVPEALRELEVYDNEALQESFVHAQEGTLREASLILEGIVCAACVWLNERHVSALEGVKSFYVNYSTHRAQLTWDDSVVHLSDVLKAISEIGYHAHPFDPGRQAELHRNERGQALRRIGLAGVGMMQVMIMAVAMYLAGDDDMDPGIRNLMRWASLVITVPVVVYSAQTFFLSAWRDLKRRHLGMDVPVSLAIGLAFLASAWATFRSDGDVYYDSVTMFTFFLLVGRFLELTARHKAGRVTEELVKLMPATANRKTSDGIQPVPVTELQPGDEVLIRPGDIIPADGRLIEGQGGVDESLLTGESLPVNKQAGETLMGGTLNMDSPLTIRVEKLGQETVLAGISRLLERAHEEKPSIALLANRVAAWFVTALLLLALLVFVYWYWQAPNDAFWITLSVLVVTCPCALSLATPVALTAATGALTRLGVLTTRGHALETLANVTDIVFDKTGTLTKGQLRLVDVQSLSDRSTQTVHRLAASLEVYSEHPIAQAVREGQQVVKAEVIEVETGRGMLGRIDGTLYRLGSLAWIKEWHAGFSDLTISGTRIYLADQSRVLGWLELNDELRPDAALALSQCKDVGIQVHLLSGDNEAAVEKVAVKLGIARCLARQLPSDKLAYVKALQQQGRIVAMVGDGMNDAPVLAGAQVSIAMGGGAQLAQASADMVLLSDRLERLPQSITHARKTLKIIRQNVAWAIGYNLLALPLAATGYIAPWMAAIGMSASSLIVVLNALRLRRYH
jgi:Cu2+-exporting ATPase